MPSSVVSLEEEGREAAHEGAAWAEVDSAWTPAAARAALHWVVGEYAPFFALCLAWFLAALLVALPVRPRSGRGLCLPSWFWRPDHGM